MRHVGKHPHTIESKAKIMLDHFFSKTIHKIDGEAKAMVVTSSRAHAVFYKQTIDRLLRDDYACPSAVHNNDGFPDQFSTQKNQFH
jgi:type I restriction enzyme, R subunit